MKRTLYAIVVAALTYAALLPGVAVAGHPASVNVTGLDGTDGFKLRGPEPVRFAGASLCGAIDLNGDGIDDAIVGPPVATGPYGGDAAGTVFVVFGTTEGFPALTNLGTLDGTNGFALRGVGTDTSAGVVAHAGDLNGDGLDDLAIGQIDVDAAGSAWVVFGSTNPFPANLELPDLDGSNGFRINGIHPGDRLGSWVGSAGDFNDDGFDDVALAAPAADPGGRTDAGEVFVVYGRANFPAAIDLATLSLQDGMLIRGDAVQGGFGTNVSGGGDINGDGISDLVAGAPGMDAANGRTYVIFGRSGGFASPVRVADLDGSDGFSTIASDPAGGAGRTAMAGDVNGDGKQDIIIGVPGADADGILDSGRAFVVFGSETFPATIALDDLDGTDGIRIDGHVVSLSAGLAVSGAGDFDGDGCDEVLIGAASEFSPFPSRAYVVFGSRGTFPPVIKLRDLDGSDGFVIESTDPLDLLGTAVAAAGDVDDDGLGDLMVGAIAAGQLFQGETYVVLGRRSCVAGTVDLAAGAPRDVLFVNGESGSTSRGHVSAAVDGPLTASIELPPAGGSGRFVLHANFGAPASDTFVDLPANIGRPCFAMLLPQSTPAAIWNNAGRPARVGSSRGFDGAPIPDPNHAPTTFLDLPSGDAIHLPLGITVTFQGAMLDPGSMSAKGASTTNAVVVTIE